MVSSAQILFYIDDMAASLKFYKEAIGLEAIPQIGIRRSADTR